MNRDQSGIENCTRRAFLITTGASTAAMAGCLGSSYDTEGNNNSTNNGTNGSDRATNTLQSQLETVHSATEQYTDPQVAREDGYRLTGPYVPGMGWHFSNQEYQQQAAQNGFSLDKPPLITYLDNHDTNGLELAAVEFGIPTSAVNEPPDLFNDPGSEATEEWHTHAAATHVFAKPDNQRTSPDNITFDDLTTKNNWTEFTPPDPDIASGDTVSLNWGSAEGKTGETTERVADIVSNHPELYTLHAWVHIDNPEGVFSPVHPDYTGEHSH